MTKPMLAAESPVERMLDLAGDDRWAFQVKYNGHRVLFSIQGGIATVLNRKGEQYQHHDRFQRGPYPALFAGLPDCLLDGELLHNGTVWLFDLSHATGSVVGPADTFSQRYEVLADFYHSWNPPEDLFSLAPTETEHAAKLQLALTCMREGGEGIIARRLTGTYSPGRRSAHVIKLKFIHDADLVVASLRFEGRDNVVLVAYDDDGKAVEVGRASAHGKGVFAMGEVLTVRYNYMSGPTPDHPSGRLVGPRIICRRDDKAPAECLTSQLHYSTEVPVYEH